MRHARRPQLPRGFEREARAILSSRGFVTDDERLAVVSVDWTGRVRGAAAAIACPRDATDLAELVRSARRYGVPLVPQGANTSLVAGAVPDAGSVVVSSREMAKITEITVRAKQASVGAGVTIEALDQYAAKQGLMYPVDLASRSSATVGGTIATNAGGSRVAFYGDTRAQVAGVEAVLGTGEVVSHMSGLVKDNTGYSLPTLLCGSEGTLGILSAARLRLVRRPTHVATALLGFDDIAALVDAAVVLSGRLETLTSAEFLLDDGMAALLSHYDLVAPFRAQSYLLVEASGSESQIEGLAKAIASLSEVRDSALSDQAERRAQLWRLRDGQSDAVASVGISLKHDVTLPIDMLASTCRRIDEAIVSRATSSKTFFFGHVLDGNVHVNVVGVDGDDAWVSDLVLGEVAAVGGSISAEHGIGRSKANYLHLARSAAELEAFRSIKRALDPDWILNPGVLLASR